MDLLSGKFGKAEDLKWVPQTVTNDESPLMARKGRRQQTHTDTLRRYPGKAELGKGTHKKSKASGAAPEGKEWKQHQQQQQKNNPWGRKSGHLS